MNTENMQIDTPSNPYICEECMQFSPDKNCYCVSGITGSKKINLVSGCISILPNGKRCKEPRYTYNGEVLYDCKKCLPKNFMNEMLYFDKMMN